MGEVFLARAQGPRGVAKTVVVKRIRPQRVTDDAARARFVDEARVSLTLSHPNIVPVFEFGELDGEYFLVMELVRGSELGRVGGIDRPPLGASAVALVGSQLCDALAYVHGRRDREGCTLVHGDVTPRNVLLSTDGHAFLTDFGLARFQPRGRDGTVRYFAPEQARGELVDGRADLYSLGLVLYEAATGRPAYDRDPARAASQVEIGLVPELDGCDPALASVLRCVLSPSADARYADARAMRRALEALLDREAGTRTRGRDELAVRVAAAAREPEIAPSGSTVATRAATRAQPRRWWTLGLLAALLIGGGVTIAMRRSASTTPTPAAHATQPASPVAAPSPAPAPAIVTSTVASGHAAAPAPKRIDPPAVRRRAAPRSEPAFLDLNAVPWANVMVDGKSVGDTPLLALPIAPGSHRVELINGTLGVHRSFDLQLAPGEHARRVEQLSTGP